MPQINIGTIANDGTGDPLRTAFQKVDQYGFLNDKTVNAAFYKTPSITWEAALNLAIPAAALLGTGAAVWIPASGLPYNASLVSFNPAIQMMREGGNAAVADVKAYGFGLGGASDAAAVAAVVATFPATSSSVVDPSKLAAPEVKRKTAWLGDSRFNQGFNNQQIAYASIMNHGPEHWARMLSNQGIVCTGEMNFTISGGTTTAQLVSQLPLALLATPGIVVILSGTNDPGAGIAAGPVSTPGTSLYNLRSMALGCVTNGARVILVPETPRADGNYTDQIETIRRGCLELQTIPGVFCADPWFDIVTPSTGQAKANIYLDGIIHPSPVGAFYIGKAIAAVVNAILPPQPILPATNTDQWSATNRHGCLTPNPMMTGSAAVTGGTAATGYSVTAPGGVAVTWTAGVADQFGNLSQQLAWSAQTPSAAGLSYIRLEIDTSQLAGANAGFALNDQIQLACYVECDQLTGVVSVENMFLQTNNGDGTIDGYSYDQTSASISLPSIAAGWKGVMLSPIYTIADLTAINFRIRFRVAVYNSRVTTGTIRVNRFALRKIVPV